MVSTILNKHYSSGIGDWILCLYSGRGKTHSTNQSAKKTNKSKRKGTLLETTIKIQQKKDNNCNTILMKMLTKRFVATEINKRK